jgi:hypothetical protein
LQFIDADDLLTPHKISSQLAALAGSSDEISVLYGGWVRLILANGEWRVTGDPVLPEVESPSVGTFLAQSEIGYVGPALIRREAFESVGGFDETMRLGEDLDLCMRLACAGFAFLRVRSSDALLIYRDTPGSLWRTSRAESKRVWLHLRSLDRSAVWLKERDGRLPKRVVARLSYTYALYLNLFKREDPESYAWLVARIRALGLRTAPSASRWPVRILTPLLGYATVVQLAHWVHGVWDGLRESGLDGLF